LVTGAFIAIPSCADAAIAPAADCDPQFAGSFVESAVAHFTSSGDTMREKEIKPKLIFYREFAIWITD
jgi:hypothetical protein